MSEESETQKLNIGSGQKESHFEGGGDDNDLNQVMHHQPVLTRNGQQTPMIIRDL